MKCSYYKNSFDNKSTIYVDVEKVIDAIKDGKWKEQIDEIRICEVKRRKSELKKHLPAVTWSGTFKLDKKYVKKTGQYELVSKRDSNLLEYSGLMVIDIDGITPKQVAKIKKECEEDVFLYCCFLSPSGGLKMIYEVDTPPEYHRNAAFMQLKEYVEDVYGVEVDKSGKNISRLCYISYDPDLYLNEEYICFNVDIEAYEEQKRKRKEELKNRVQPQGDVSHDLEHIWSVAKKWMDNKGQHYVTGNRNEYIHKIACILNRAGVGSDQIISLITSHHNISREMFGELITTVNGVSKRNRYEFGSQPIYDNRNKNKTDIFNGIRGL
jgi:hypothetical protein